MKRPNYGDEDLEDIIWGDVPVKPPLSPEFVADDIFEAAGRFPLGELSLEEFEGKTQMWQNLRQLAKRHKFSSLAALKWLEYTEGKIPYAILKISGSCLNAKVARDIADLSHVISLAVVIGGGEQITEECVRRGLPVLKDGPWRATPKEVLDVVVETMTRETEHFSRLIERYGGRALPLVGTPHQPLIFADKVDTFRINGEPVDAGYFGTIPRAHEKIYLNDTLLEKILGSDDIPIIAALGHQWAYKAPEQGYQPLNIDGDEAIRIIARRVGAEECLFVTPSGGVKTVKDGQESVVPVLSLQDFEMRRNGLKIDESMALKLSAGFMILREYEGQVGVALVPQQKFVRYLLDRNLNVSREPNDPLFGTPTHRRHRVYYGTTLILSRHDIT